MEYSIYIQKVLYKFYKTMEEYINVSIQFFQNYKVIKYLMVWSISFIFKNLFI